MARARSVRSTGQLRASGVRKYWIEGIGHTEVLDNPGHQTYRSTGAVQGIGLAEVGLDRKLRAYSINYGIQRGLWTRPLDRVHMRPS